MFRLIGCVAALAVVVGCATYSAQPIDVSEVARQFEARRLDDAGLIALARKTLPADRAFPPARWGGDDLVLAAVYFHPGLRAARARIAEAEAGRTSAVALPNPTLEITPEHVADGGAGTAAWVLGFKLDWPLAVDSKRDVRLKLAEARLLERRAALVETWWMVRAAVKRAWLADVGARLEVTTLTSELDDRRAWLGALEKRFQAGDIAWPSLSGAELETQRLARALFAAESLARATRVDLARTLSVPFEAVSTIEISSTELDDELLEIDVHAARETGLRRRADIARALAAYWVAESELELEVAKQRPDVHLLPGITWDQGTRKFALGLSVGLPILDRNEGPIAEAEARRRLAAADFDRVQADAIGLVTARHGAHRSAVQDSARARDLVRRARADLERSERALRAGEVDGSHVLEARMLLSAAQRVSAAAEVAAAERRIDLEEALGAPVANPLDDRVLDSITEIP